MSRTNDEMLAHVSEMSRVALASVEQLAKAQRQLSDPYGNDDMLDGEDVEELHGILHQEGRGGLSDARPEGVPTHRPVHSGGWDRLADEHPFTRGDGSTEAADRLSRELTAMREGFRKARKMIQELLDSEDVEDEHPNQTKWPVQDVSGANLMDGTAMQRASVGDLLNVVAGRGAKSLPVERLAKSAAVLAKSAGAAIEAAADDLNLSEQLALGTLLARLSAASAGDVGAAEMFRQGYENLDPHLQSLFNV